MNTSPEHLYLDLLKKTLSFTLWPEPPLPVEVFNYRRSPRKRMLVEMAAKYLKRWRFCLAEYRHFTDKERIEGQIWPGYADTMIGLRRLDNIQYCIETVIKQGVPGDLIETGVWRGGGCIFMRAVLAAYHVNDRRVFVADSFVGLPKPEPDKYAADKGDDHHVHSSYLAVSKEQVEENFKKYGLLDEQVVFLKGWFKDTLPIAPIEKLAILRLDGDMYSSTIEALTSLYPKLSPGGFCIVDDYTLPGCKQAIHDFRDQQKINSPLIKIDDSASYWVR